MTPDEQQERDQLRARVAQLEATLNDIPYVGHADRDWQVAQLRARLAEVLGALHDVMYYIHHCICGACAVCVTRAKAEAVLEKIEP